MPRHQPPGLIRQLYPAILLPVVLAALAWGFLPRFSGHTRNEKGASTASAKANDAAVPPTTAEARARIDEAYAKLPLSFEANEGQVRGGDAVKFVSRGEGYSLFLTPTGATLTLDRPAAPAAKTKADAGAEGVRRKSAERESAVLQMSLVGANSRPEINGLAETPGKSNYFIGRDASKWRTNVSHFSKVEYREVYPGVDMTFYGNQRQLEYDFIVAPGADPRAVALKFKGADRIEIDEAGQLVLHTRGGLLRQHKPFVYQEAGGERRQVAGAYVLKGRGEVGFEVGAYDPARTLVIDPTLSYSSYLGGSLDDEAYAVVVDAVGNAYVAGRTASNNFPLSATPYQPTYGGGSTDVFVSKFDMRLAGAASLVYSTYLGGSNADDGFGVAIDAAGNAYVTGRTSSTDFPTFNGLATKNTDTAAFASKLDAAGSSLLYSTYIADNDEGTEEGYAIAADSSGAAYVAGSTDSETFPVTNGFQPALVHGEPSRDAFVAKLDTTLTGDASLAYSTYLGGDASDFAYGIAVDEEGHAYVAGTTQSAKDFPLKDEYQANLNGTSDAFVTKIDTFAAGAASLVYSTYFGGSNRERALALAVKDGVAYVAGDTFSDDLPLTGQYDSTLGGGSDALVFALKDNQLLYSTYLGGDAGDESAHGIAVAPDNTIVVAGLTASTNFPVVNPSQASYGGGASDYFVSRLSVAGGPASLLFSTYLGGSDSESNGVGLGSHVAVDPAGNIYVAASTVSDTETEKFPITANAYQSANAGSTDAFVVKIAPGSIVGVTTTADSGAGSLRQAILDSNATPGTQTIAFNIPGAGLHTITPASALPAITDTVVIDGYTQPGASANTLAQGSNAVLTIELSGPGAGSAGLRINGGGSVVRGLVVNRFDNAAAIDLNADGNRVEGCFLGTDAVGTSNFADQSREGVSVNSAGNTIGGTTPDKRNLISGHRLTGINIFGSGVGANVVEGNLIGTDKTGGSALGNGQAGITISGYTGNTIGGRTAAARNVISGNGSGVNLFTGSNNVQGNYIGTDAAGTIDLGNSGTGIFMQGAADNLVGGLTATPGEAPGNVISGNGSSGIDLNGNVAPGHVISGNLIGTDATGLSAIGNGGGITIRNSGGGNLVGDANVQGRNVISGNTQHALSLDNNGNRVLNNYIGTGRDGSTALGNARNGVLINSRDNNAVNFNRIAFNGEDGVAVNFFNTGTRNALLSNSIFSNNGLGIDLGNNGVTPNDAGDADNGANNLQNFPVLASAVSSDGGTNVQGTLNSTPGTTFSLQFFANATCDSSGNGEGQTLIGETQLTTDDNGGASFNSTLPMATAVGQFVTATATDPSGNTSEFSACRAVAGPSASADLSLTKTDSPDPSTAGANLTYTIQVTNNGPDAATGVVVVDALPAGVSFVSANATQGACSGTSNVNCNLGALTNGATATVTIVVTPNAAGTLNNTASVAANEADPDSTNNSATATTIVNAAPVVVRTIAGRVTNAGGVGIEGVNLTLTGSQSATTTTAADGTYSFKGLAQGGNFTVTPSEVGYVFTPQSRAFNNLSADQTTADFTGTPTNFSINGHVADAGGAPLGGVTLSVGGSFTFVTETDAGGNYSIPNVPANSSFTITPDKSGFSFDPPRRSFTNLTTSVSADFTATPQTSPTPTPDPSDDFSAPAIDPNRWNTGVLTQPPAGFDPLVLLGQPGGRLEIRPREGANGPSFNGYVSSRAIDLNVTPTVGVEIVQAADPGAQTIFGIGQNRDNWYRFVVEDAPASQTTARRQRGVGIRPKDVSQTLSFEFNINGSKFSTGIGYDASQHRHWRFRYDAPAGKVYFETSPDSSPRVWTIRLSADLARDHTRLIAELSAGSLGPLAFQTVAVFDNYRVALPTALQFSSPALTAREDGGNALVTVTRTGTVESPTTLDFASVGGGTATPGLDYHPVSGTLRFEIGETIKTFQIQILDDALEEGPETINLAIANVLGGAPGANSSAVLTINDDESSNHNPIDDTPFFVRQNYLDFLNREPDAAGLAFWTNNIESCGADAACREAKRIDTSAAFFLSIEFQETGYLTYRFYKATYNRRPAFAEYLPDSQTLGQGVVVGDSSAEARLDANKRAFAEAWVNRQAFKDRYGKMNSADYVDALFANAGVTPTEQERTALIVELLTNRETRASVLLKILDDAEFVRREFNRAFVLGQYFGYLRRDPDEAGYQFWLGKLNEFGGDFRRAEMVKAFITSTEYRARFGRP
ncbi:MAG TPA: SBBP repeat-containing protein [Pyrinomonadaceae bacterium]|nr:SBBP repeat-containing protein [Pyrinomonadaceae bacterium]